jgi:hypothetical protein
MTKTLEKCTTEKNLIFFLSKIAIYLSIGLHKERPIRIQNTVSGHPLMPPGPVPHRTPAPYSSAATVLPPFNYNSSADLENVFRQKI